MTDSGRMRSLLDDAARAWPDLADDRKALLLRLAERGAQDLPPAPADLDDEIQSHVGRWVAIQDGRILTVRDDVEGVVRWLRDHGTSADSMFKVLAGEDEIVSEHGLAST